jgi:hypothetical protein
MRIESGKLWQRAVQDVRLSVDKDNGLAAEDDALLYAQLFDELISMHLEHNEALPTPAELSNYLVKSGWTEECAIEVEEFFDNLLLYRMYKAGKLPGQRPPGHFTVM